jgi:hypothetical protein
VAGVNALAARTGSYTTTSSFNNYTASNNTTMSCVSSTATSALVGVGTLASQTGSYATTGSNTFVGGQYLSSSFNPTGFTTTASLYTDGGLRVTKDAYISGTLYLNNLTVFGTQSVAYISSSQLNIGTNIISVNTDTPSVRFGGLAVYDSGSTGLTGSILWDSQNNHWVYSNPSGSSYSGGMFISGPRTSTLGSETGTTACMLLAGQGGDHLTSSMIYHSSTVTCIPNTLAGGVGCFSGGVCSPAFVGGTVSGTTGAFSSCITAGARSFVTGTPGYLFDVQTTDTNKPRFQVYVDDTNGVDLVSGYDTTAKGLRLNTGGNIRANITSTGITCFACQVCAPSFISSGTICSTGNTCFGGMSIINSCLGIGTATPGAKLQVYGNLQIHSGATGCSDPLIFGGETGAPKKAIFLENFWMVYQGHDNEGHKFRSVSSEGAGTDDVTITGGGSVGIGNNLTSPEAALQVAKIGTDDQLVLGSTATNRDIAMFMYSGTTKAEVLRFQSATNFLIGSSAAISNLHFNPGGSLKMIVQSGGNVGIATSTPAYKLDVNGTGRFTACSCVQENIIVKSANTGFSKINIDSVTGASSQLAFLENETQKGVVGYRPSTCNVFLANATGDILNISCTGNVGIGTTIPDRLLHINGDTSTTTPLQKVQNAGTGDAVTEYRVTGASWYVGIDNSDSDKFKIGQDPLGTSDRFTIADGGSVGISTTSPSSTYGTLTVAGTGISIADDGNAKLQIGRYNSSTCNAYIKMGANACSLRFTNAADTADVVVMEKGGNVGIGTSSPSGKLDVQGGYSYFYGLRISGADTGNTIYQPTGDFSISSDGGNIRLLANVSTANINFGTQGTERMRITSGGLVSINQTSGYAIFNITGIDCAWGEGIVMNPAPNGYNAINFRAEGRTGSCFIATWQLGKSSSSESSAGEIFSLNRAGLTGGAGYRADAAQQWKTNGDSIFGFNVGIGTCTPAVKFDVNGNTIIRGSLDFRATGTNNGNLTINDNGGGTATINNSSNSFLNITSASRTTITGGDFIVNNNVGINNTSPNEKLDVNGAVQVRGESVGYGTTQCVGMLDFYAGATRLLSFGGNTSTPGGFRFYSAGQNNTSGRDVVFINSTGVTCFGASICIASGTLYLPGAIGGRTSQIEFGNSGTADILGMPNLTSTFYLKYGTNSILFTNDNGGEILRMCNNKTIAVNGPIVPTSNGTIDLGTSSLRWCTVYTSDLSLSNGIGDYTMVEGENDLFLYNNKQCKVYKFMLQEVCPEIAPAKRST